MYDEPTTDHTRYSTPDSQELPESEAVAAASVASRPPHTNRGVRIGAPGGLKWENPEKSDDYAKCSWDWYQATIPARSEVIQSAFLAAFGGSFEEVPGINGYTYGVAHSKLRFSIYWGGHNTNPNVKATSHHAQLIAPWLRQAFPEHRVSRADVAFDFSFPHAFDWLTSQVEPVAEKRGVSSKFVGDLRENCPDWPEEKRSGRTWYFGSFRSDMMLTIYEKGFEMRSKGVVNADPNLVRLEVRVRPQKSRKALAARLDPFELVGFSKWISTAIGEILEEAPTVQPDYDKMEKGPLAALEHMARQYAGQIRAFLEGADRGGEPRSWDDLNRFLHKHLSIREAERQRAGNSPSEPLPPLRPCTLPDAD